MLHAFIMKYCFTNSLIFFVRTILNIKVGTALPRESVCRTVRLTACLPVCRPSESVRL